MILLITEKPYLSKEIIESLKLKDIYFCSHNSYIYEFDYDNYSINSDPKYMLKKDFLGSKAYNKISYIDCNGNQSLVFDLKNSTNNEKINFFSSITEIWLIPDPDHSGFRSIDLFKNNLIFDIPITYSFNLGCQVNELKNTFSKRLIFNVNSESKFRELYKYKDYIDYHFNYLMMKKFKISLTRNMLDTLLLIQSLSENIRAFDVDQKMFERNIGSPASRRAILKFLTNEDLITFNEFINISPKGKDFLDKNKGLLTSIDFYNDIKNGFFSSINSKRKTFEAMKPMLDNYLISLEKELNIDF